MSSTLKGLIDFDQKSLAIAATAIAFNPIFWNTVARQEYRNKVLTRLFRGNSLYACYFLAIQIFSLGIFRDYLYERALHNQPILPLLQALPFQIFAWLLIGTGNVLVISSMYALGLTGTYLGDYFGILMDEPVTGFPFNIVGAPMYYGSTMSFLGTALLYARPAGVVLTGEVLLVYLVALAFEDPFTRGIYAGRGDDVKVVKEGRRMHLRDGKVLSDGKKDT